MQSKLEIKSEITKILEKGKPINDIIFYSKNMGYSDIAFMLQLCRPEKKSNFFDRNPKNWYGWSSKKLYDFVDNPMWGGDGFQQLLFGCVAALHVYTEDEIVTVLLKRQEFHNAS